MPQIQEEVLHTVYQMLDMDNNVLTLRWHPHNIYTVSIYLVKTKENREIAQVDVDRACISVTRNKQRHWFRSDCGYGFNWTLINKNLPFYVKNILLIEHDMTEVDYFLIPIDKIRETGHKMSFEQKAGMELQWFMKMVDIVKYRVKDMDLLPELLVSKK